MAAVPFAIKMVFIAAIAFLVGLIVLYHIWLERRSRAEEAAALARAAAVERLPTPMSPPPAAGVAGSTRRTAVEPRPAPLRRAP